MAVATRLARSSRDTPSASSVFNPQSGMNPKNIPTAVPIAIACVESLSWRSCRVLSRIHRIGFIAIKLPNFTLVWNSGFWAIARCSGPAVSRARGHSGLTRMGARLRPLWEGSRTLIFPLRPKWIRIRGRGRLGNDCEERETSQRALDFLGVSFSYVLQSFSFFNRNRPRTRPRPRVLLLLGRARI